MTNVVIEVIVEILAGALPLGGRYEPRHEVVVARPKSDAKITPDIPRTFVPNMIQAIFFDFNGVIINDERIHLKAYREVLSAEGVELKDEDYFASLGMDDVAFVRAAYARRNKALDDETLRAVIDREHAKHRELIANDLPVPSGIVSFIKAAARYYDLGIVSMAVRSEIDHVLKLAGLTNQFSLFVSAEPGLKHKPAPDCYQVSLEFLNQKRRGRQA